jgi:hypothetical protein
VSASGAGRYACSTQAQLADGSSEPLPNPTEVALEAWAELPWIFKADTEALLAKLKEHGLTICHDVISDG